MMENEVKVENSPEKLDTVGSEDKVEPKTNITSPKEKENHQKSLSSSTKLNHDQEAKLQKLIESIPEIVKKLDDSGYDEIFGYRINVEGEDYVDVAQRNEILLKFLIADNYDVPTAKTRIINTMNWRRKFQPLSAAFNENFDPKLDKLGAITCFTEESANYFVSTWNLYGSVQTPKKLFDQFGEESNGKREGSQFLRWRVGIMEKALVFLDFTNAKNHKIVQIHDYKNTSMFRIDKGMKKSIKETISIFGSNYPELLTLKFFVNIPSIMSWGFSFITSLGIINQETLNKFRPLNHSNLTKWFSPENLPSNYGGSNKANLFDLDKSNVASIPEYGKIILEKINKTTIEEMNLSVE